MTAGVESPDVEARWITETASGTDATEWLDVEREQPTRSRAGARRRDDRARRVRGEPLQYVLGSWSFRGLDLMVDPRVLIPRPETEWVVEIALARGRTHGPAPRRVTAPPRRVVPSGCQNTTS